MARPKSRALLEPMLSFGPCLNLGNYIDPFFHRGHCTGHAGIPMFSKSQDIEELNPFCKCKTTLYDAVVFSDCQEYFNSLATHNVFPLDWVLDISNLEATANLCLFVFWPPWHRLSHKPLKVSDSVRHGRPPKLSLSETKQGSEVLICQCAGTTVTCQG